MIFIFIKLAVSCNIVLIQINMQPELYMTSLTGFTASLSPGINAPSYRNQSTDFRSKPTDWFSYHETLNLGGTFSSRFQYNNKYPVQLFFPQKFDNLLNDMRHFYPMHPFSTPLKTSENQRVHSEQLG